MTTKSRPPKLVTPLTIGAAIVVAVFGVANIALEPERTLVWLLGILFLPVAMFLLTRAVRRGGRVARSVGKGGGVRAGLVGAGVALAAAFALSFTDQMGWTGEDSTITSGPVWIFLLAALAIGVDILSARLEAKAEEDDGSGDAGSS